MTRLGNRVVPGAAPQMRQLLDFYGEARTVQDGAPEVQQKWGDTVVMPGYGDLGLSGPQSMPFFPMVSIGPFDEPRPLALEASYDPIFQMYLEYELTVGIGQAIARYSVSQLPPVLLAQSLQVSARRADPGVLFAPQPISVWAAPAVPRMSVPTPIVSEVVNFTAAASIAQFSTNGAPRGATHVMVSVDPVAIDASGSSTVFMRIDYRPYPETGAGGAAQVEHLMAAAARVGRVQPGVTATDAPNQPGYLNPTILPVPLGQVVLWQLRRIENANAGAHVVTWLRA